MLKKFELVETNLIHFGKPMYQVKSLIDINNSEKNIRVKVGELGGYLVNETNLSQDISDSSWLSTDSFIYDTETIVKDDSLIRDSKLFSQTMIVNSNIYSSKIHSGVVENSKIYSTNLEGESTITNSEIVNLYSILGLQVTNSKIQTNGIDIKLQKSYLLENIKDKYLQSYNPKTFELIFGDFSFDFEDSNFFAISPESKELRYISEDEYNALTINLNNLDLNKIYLESVLDLTKPKKISDEVSVYPLKKNPKTFVDLESDISQFDGKFSGDNTIVNSTIKGNKLVKNSKIINSYVKDSNIVATTLYDCDVDNCKFKNSSLSEIIEVINTNLELVTFKKFKRISDVTICGHALYLEGSNVNGLIDSGDTLTNINIPYANSKSCWIEEVKGKTLFVVQPMNDVNYPKGYFYVFGNSVLTHISLELSDGKFVSNQKGGSNVLSKSSYDLIVKLLKNYKFEYPFNFYLDKYKLLEDDFIYHSSGNKLYRIVATTSFDDVKEGDLGGYISTSTILPQTDKSWVDADSIIDSSKIRLDNTKVYGSKLSDGGRKINRAFVIENSMLVDCSIENFVGKISNSKLEKVTTNNHLYVIDSNILSVTSKLAISIVGLVGSMLNEDNVAYYNEDNYGLINSDFSYFNGSNLLVQKFTRDGGEFYNIYEYVIERNIFGVPHIKPILLEVGLEDLPNDLKLTINTIL